MSIDKVIINIINNLNFTNQELFNQNYIENSGKDFIILITFSPTFLITTSFSIFEMTSSIRSTIIHHMFFFKSPCCDSRCTNS